MGALRRTVGQKPYLDANLFIYALENLQPWSSLANGIFRALEAGEFSAVTSELTIAECLVKPMKLGRNDLVQAYLGFMRDRPFLELVPIDRDILLEAARRRADSSLTLPDAIHVATSFQSGCDSFLSNDKRLATVPGLTTLPLSDIH